MVLRTRQIFSDRSEEDGIRISVMRRHTLNDGVTPDARIKYFDIWWRSLGAPDKLVGSYLLRKEITWDQYQEKYVDYLRSNVSKQVDYLALMALTENVTILCEEELPKEGAGYMKCHRRLLAEECQLRYPQIGVMHV